MSKRVVTVHQENAEEAKEIPAIAETVAGIEAINEQIDINEDILQAGTKGLTQSKTITKNAQINQT
jgi:hypothetical protein